VNINAEKLILDVYKAGHAISLTVEEVVGMIKNLITDSQTGNHDATLDI
jgi:hypothetical protein